MYHRSAYCLLVLFGFSVNAQNVTVRLDQTKQTMAGFGINNNWAPAMTDAEADRMFDSTTGIGLTILRIGMGSNGEPFNGTRCWDDIRKATARGCRYIIGTLWSPPGYMKDDGTENDGGHLLPQYYEQWANTIAAFPAKVRQGSGVNLYGMSPQNETDFASCGRTEPCNGNYPTTLFTGKEYADFLKVVGPKLHALNPPVRVIAPEASEWLHTWSNESACCSEPNNRPSSDPLNCGFPSTCTPGEGYDYGHSMHNDSTAWAQVDILGTHQYDSQVAEPWPGDVPRGNIPVWQTEMSGVKWWPEQGTIVRDASAPGGYRVSPTTHIDNGVAVAEWIHNAITVGDASAWCYWWYRAIDTDDNEGLLAKSGTVAKRFYTFGNFSKFVRPGMTRVDMTGTIPADVLLSAYKGTNGTVVIVAVNKNTSQVAVPVTIAGGTVSGSMTPWVTSAGANNLTAQTPVPLSGGAFTAALAATSVTTFVGTRIVAVLPQGRRNLEAGTGGTRIHAGFAGSRVSLLNVPVGRTWKFDLVDISGRVVEKAQGTGTGNAVDISLAGLRSGVYVATLRCGDERYRTMVTLAGQR